MNGMKAISIIGLLLLVGHWLNGQGISWQLTESGGKRVLQLSGLSNDQLTTADGLQLYVGTLQQWPGAEQNSILGEVSQERGALVFHPRFPFRSGVNYTAFWRGATAFNFTIPTDTPRAELISIYPTAEALPANLLKIYLHFSAPMGEGRAYEHLTLLSASGDTVYQPFVPLEPELWSEDQRRLTLWLDPGRVKRGLLSHEAYGVVIEEEQQYTLVVDSGWKDAGGRPLGQTRYKTFRVGAPDYEQPRTESWRVQLPYAGTQEPLTVDFGESLDHALAERMLTVISAADGIRAGHIKLSDRESKWYFYPEETWTEGDYEIRIDSALEDLAGNNLNRPFDREITSEEKQLVVQDFYTLKFRIKASR